MFKKISGTRDILPEEVSKWQAIEDISRFIFLSYNYQEIRPPLLEDATLFNRSLGEFTEIVQKQMFLVKNKEEIYALRPEGTASIVRSYIENNLDKKAGFIKLYYMGPMFRLERPQKGRLRQFHHIGCEAIGSFEPSLDVEVIALADRLLTSYGVTGYKININSLGCLKDKKELTKILHKGLQNKLGRLCDDCRMRFEGNILRILDCKNESCQEVISNLHFQQQYLCQDCSDHFTRVREGLDSLKIAYEISPHLVRGLDYYTRTVFEIKHSELGAQDALGAGGRYDTLVSDLGGPDIGAIGFAFGVERLLLVIKEKMEDCRKSPLVYVIALGEAPRKKALWLLDYLRQAAIRVDTDYENKSLKAALRRANDLGARLVLILGEDELKKDVVTLKDMASGIQKEVGEKNILREISPLLDDQPTGQRKNEITSKRDNE